MTCQSSYVTEKELKPFAKKQRQKGSRWNSADETYSFVDIKNSLIHKATYLLQLRFVYDCGICTCIHALGIAVFISFCIHIPGYIRLKIHSEVSGNSQLANSQEEFFCQKNKYFQIMFQVSVLIINFVHTMIHIRHILNLYNLHDSVNDLESDKLFINKDLNIKTLHTLQN